jgi:hypothetical protein
MLAEMPEATRARSPEAVSTRHTLPGSLPRHANRLVGISLQLRPLPRRSGRLSKSVAGPMKCQFCGAYSLTFDLLRNAFVCHVYGATIPAEGMPA